MDTFKLVDLIDVSILQQLQDSFSEFTGMGLVAIDEMGTPITRSSGFSYFCDGLVRQSEEGYHRCEICSVEATRNAMEQGRSVVYCCHAGLVDFASPIMLGDRIIGGMVGGQVRADNLSREKMERDAIEMGIDPKVYIAEMSETVEMPFHKVEAAANFLAATTRALSELAFNNYLALKKSRELESAARSQSNFIMNMSMDMEKQLSGWMNSARDALMGGGEGGVEDTMMRILGESAGVCAQMSDTVEYIRLSGGEVSLNEMVYDPRALVRQVVEKSKPALLEKNISMTVEIDSSVPQYLLGAAGLLGQILHKLIVSGAHYTLEGGVTVKASCLPGSYATLFRVVIQDTGGGVSPKDLEYLRGLFNNSYLVDRSKYSDEVEGLTFPSIGAMVKQLSGTVDIESELGRGSSVIVTVPQLEVKG